MFLRSSAYDYLLMCIGLKGPHKFFSNAAISLSDVLYLACGRERERQAGEKGESETEEKRSRCSVSHSSEIHSG